MNSKIKRYLNLLAISIGGGVIFRLAYLRDVFYDPLQEALGVSNTQMGLLITFLAITSFVSYLPAGWLVDLVPVKYLIPAGLILTGILGFVEATYPPFIVILIIQMGYGLTTTLLFWDAMIKGTRIAAEGVGDHGRMFGLLEGLRGVVGTLASFGALYFFNAFGEGPEGLQKTIIFYSVVMVVIGVLCFFLIDKNEVEGTVDAKGAMKGLLSVVKMPKVWLAGGIVFFGYAFYNGLSFMSPMLTEMFGMSATTASAVSIIRQYAIGIFAAPLGGIIADKMGSRIGFLKNCILSGAVVTAVFLFIPYSKSTLMIGIIVMMLVAVFMFMMRGTYYSTTNEIGISITAAGAAAGVLSLLGNFPDFYIFTLYGNMLDRFSGAAGYKAVFVLMILHALGAVICAAVLHRMIKNDKKVK